MSTQSKFNILIFIVFTYNLLVVSQTIKQYQYLQYILETHNVSHA